ncbi:1,4-dihydroxy-2-naphthoyl-CoA synthase [Leifsonia sp. Root112D2]|jgi:naphthoate synthase|uniref:1,4-dihydroxy-2-naphthoyl-CoA synthase n=1 Tax=Leifsonia sp. Root112D2 TaxID=1736426 RepID=UPI0006F1CE10|nr:1,4-dihydroxy-2-naphthoyl-CoA synthase [Leifsonia sp. Root112D2]KQV06362.1 naphthoate synthase [Leifsonia sp. Root112D2]
MTTQVSEIFDASQWADVAGYEALSDVTYHHSLDGRIARVAFNRPEVRNAFRPHTVDELYAVLENARTNPRIGVVLLTGNGPSPKDGGWAFCSGGDQRIRGRDGYQYEATPSLIEERGTSVSKPDAAGGFETRPRSSTSPQPTGAGVGASLGRLHILEVQRLIRFMPKVVIAVVPGWAAGGGHSLHVVCDLSIASAEHGRFKQTDADVGSFDAGYGSAYFARQIGQKFAREVFFLAQEYSAERAYEMGAVNAVVPHAELEATALEWARTILTKSPTAIRMLKYAFNAVDDGLVGQQLFAGEATRLAYGTDEAVEGKEAFLEKREPDWSPFPWQY